MAEATLKPPKESVLSEEEKPDDVKTPDYTPEQMTYIGRLQKRMDSARNKRDQNHGEFDYMSYIEHWWANERGANTLIKHKKNKGDPTYQTGTLRTKMFAYLATLESLNLKPNITAFGDDQLPINALGDAIEDIMDKVGELENDTEKRRLRQYEMEKHGTIYIEDIWLDKYIVEKTVNQSFNGDSKNAKWSSKMVKADGRPVRSIIPNTAVYKGDMTKYFITDQPYIFTLQIIKYEEAEQIYGKWDMWEYVSKSKKSFTGAGDQEMIQNAWRLTTDLADGQVEVIKYQDKIANEFQIILNGIPMLPMGYPLTEISPDGEYTIIQQNRAPIREKFSEGKSFIFENKNKVAVLDMMYKLSVLKTYKSFSPPRLNLSDRVVSRGMFMPAQITRGIRPNQIPTIDEKESQGVTNAEFAFTQEVLKDIDRGTVSQTTAGAKEEGGRVTATQILQLQRQAKIMMGYTIASNALLEWKLAHKRLALLLSKWFDPVDQTLNKARQELVNRYRTTARERMLEGVGRGIRLTVPTEEIPAPEEIKEMEKTAKRRVGVPVKMIMINPKEIKKAKLVWVIVINPKEKKTSEFSKIMFGEMIRNLREFGYFEDPDWGRRRIAEVWEEDPNKMFAKGGMPPGMPPGAPGGTPEGLPAPRAATPVKVAPAAEEGVSRRII